MSNGSPPKVVLDNQWGKSSDHEGVSLHQLFLAMHHPNNACSELEKDVQACHASGKVDSALEFDLFRVRFCQSSIESAEASKIEAKVVSFFFMRSVSDGGQTRKQVL
ncbi:MAG: hypothetical protein K8F91_11445 [Candidatus Obscuribacterales bacterium]|nr:hypothetical protein [Candidatus Obscuribacterales bacterium]